MTIAISPILPTTSNIRSGSISNISKYNKIQSRLPTHTHIIQRKQNNTFLIYFLKQKHINTESSLKTTTKFLSLTWRTFERYISDCTTNNVRCRKSNLIALQTCFHYKFTPPHTLPIFKLPYTSLVLSRSFARFQFADVCLARGENNDTGETI